MTAVSLSNLSRQFGATSAVDNLCLDFASGRLAALLGPSGCGKTTTLRMIAGLLAPTGGDICFDERSVLNVPAERRGAVMVFQKHLLFPHMNVGENVGFGLRMRGEAASVIRRKVGEMLELVQLPGYETRPSHALSGGQQQRVALARALIISPAVLLLDEPLANLDANLRLEMRKLIRSIQQTLSMTTLFVTHDQEEAIMLADQVALMSNGRLLQAGSPRTLYEEPVSPEVARFFRNENLLAGERRGRQVFTEAGVFVLDDEFLRREDVPGDGLVWLTVRPEHLEAAATHGENCIAVCTRGDVVYMGGYSQLQVAVGNSTWTLYQSPHALAQMSLGNVGAGREAAQDAGRQLYLHLPRRHLWLMPR